MTDLKEKLPLSKHKRKKKEEMLRIEELQKLLEETGGDVDPETVVSLYMPHRRRKLFADAILRLDKMSLWLIALLAVIGILFIAAFAQEKMGNFTINLNRLELYRKGIAISDDPYFTRPTARLIANTVADATNISIDDLPDDLDEVSGGHNGDNYMAYTYYVRNAGKEDVWYNARITLDSCAKGAEEAVRVAVWHNGTRTVYAMPAADGQPEAGCVSFADDKTVCAYREENFLVGNVDKYTIVIWMEGDDPECVDKIVGGSVEFTMRIDADNDDDTNLLTKFIRDIMDTLKSDRPISAAGNDAPDYYSGQDVTWFTRRNGGSPDAAAPNQTTPTDPTEYTRPIPTDIEQTHPIN